MARFGVYSEMHKGRERTPFPILEERGREGGKVGSRGTIRAAAVRCCAPGLIRLEHTPKRANAQIAFILAS